VGPPRAGTVERAELVRRALPQVDPPCQPFPGAEGFGAFAKGGRGGDVYHVVNLNASGAGSFAYGVENIPPSGRTIVFDVSGYADIRNELTASVKPLLTIAGQTAPGDGFGLKNGTFWLSAGDAIIRHMRFRDGLQRRLGGHGQRRRQLHLGPLRHDVQPRREHVQLQDPAREHDLSVLDQRVGPRDPLLRRAVGSGARHLPPLTVGAQSHPQSQSARHAARVDQQRHLRLGHRLHHG
jgi:hypothetical protein